MAQGSALIHPTFQRPCVVEGELHETIPVAAWHGCRANADRHRLVRVHRLQMQGVARLHQSQAEATTEILASTAQGVAVAVEVSAADAAEIEVVQGWIDQAIRARGPAERSAFDLLENKQLPFVLANGLGEHCEAGLIQRLGVKQCPCSDGPRQHSQVIRPAPVRPMAWR